MENSARFSDESIRAAILVEFAEKILTAKNELRVGVMNGIAHLAGKLDTLEERAAVEMIVRGIDGVRGVVNRIEAPGAPSPARIVNLELNHPNQSSSKEDMLTDD